MKRFLSFITFIIIFAVAALAQADLNIGSLFDGKYLDSPNATEVVLKGGSLKEYHLDEYHSLTIVGDSSDAPSIERLVRRDAMSAVEREVTYRQGGIYFAFYQLPAKGKKNRYLFYLNNHRAGGDKIMLVYMSGKASASDIRKLINFSK